MGRNPELLLQSVLDAPENFENGVGELLQQLTYKQRGWEDLGPQERQLLDRATLDFASEARPQARKPNPQPTSSEASPAAKAALDELEVELVYNEHGPPTPLGMDVPEEPPTFWWRKT